MTLIKNAYAAAATVLPADWIGVGSAFNTLGGALGAIVNIVFAVGVAVCLAFAIVGGIKYASSAGDPKAVGQARNTITNAVIGFIIVVGFRFIMYFVLNLIGAQGAKNPIEGGVLPYAYFITAWNDKE